jgi:hypothetical protein
MFRYQPNTSGRALSKLALSMALVLLTTRTALSDGISTSFDGINTAISGYGTAGGTFTSNSKYAYYQDPSEFTGASNSFDVGLDSRIGVQVNVSFGTQWSVTAQEEMKQRGSTTFDPGTQWLYVQYQPYSDLKLRVGRVVLPTFLVSDVIDVGYAVPWFQRPNDLYTNAPYDYLDGVQGVWQHSIGDFRFTLEGSYGTTSAVLLINALTVDANSKSTFNAAASVAWRSLLLRYAETDLRSNTYLPSSQQQYYLPDKFHCLGLQYDDGRALLMSEWAKRSESNVPGFNLPFERETAWYAAAGWRFGPLLPLLMYSARDVDSSLIEPSRNYHTWAVSLRYDILRNLDLKAQIMRASAANGSYFLNSSTASDERVNVYSLGADFVF